MTEQEIIERQTAIFKKMKECDDTVVKLERLRNCRAIHVTKDTPDGFALKVGGVEVNGKPLPEVTFSEQTGILDEVFDTLKGKQEAQRQLLLSEHRELSRLFAEQ